MFLHYAALPHPLQHKSQAVAARQQVPDLFSPVRPVVQMLAFHPQFPDCPLQRVSLERGSEIVVVQESNDAGSSHLLYSFRIGFPVSTSAILSHACPSP